MARKSLIQIRRDTAANWTSTNPVLAAGEQGLETDTLKTKYGDGTTAWTSLDYSGGLVPDATFSVKGKVYLTEVDVRDYGAVGDGTTDDRAHIQAAWDAAVTAGLPLRIPKTIAGYLIGGTGLSKDADDICILSNGATLISDVTYGSTVLKIGNDSGPTARDSIIVDGLNIDMNNKPCWGMSVGWSYRQTLRNINVENPATNSWSMIYLGLFNNMSATWDAHDYILDNINLIYGGVSNGWEAITLGFLKNVNLEHVRVFDKPSGPGLLGYNSEYVTLNGCYFYKSKAQFGGRGPIDIVNTTFDRGWLHIYAADQVTMTGGAFIGDTDDYGTGRTNGVSIQGNYFSSYVVGEVPFYLEDATFPYTWQCKGIKFIGVDFSASNAFAIVAATTTVDTETFLSAHDITFTDCVVSDSYWDGIKLAAKYLTITDNRVKNAGIAGSSSTLQNFMLAAEYGIFTGNQSYDDQGSPTVARDVVFTNEYVSTYLPAQEWVVGNNQLNVTSNVLHYFNSGFTTTKPAAITIRGTDSLVTGPTSATDNAMARFDGITGKLVQNSTVTVNDAGGIASTIANAGNTAALTLVQNDTTNNPRVLDLTNAGTGIAVNIAQNGNGKALQVSDGGTSTSVTIAKNATGKALAISRNQSNGLDAVASITQANASDPQDALQVNNAGTGKTILVTDTGTGTSVSIAKNSTGTAFLVTRNQSNGSSVMARFNQSNASDPQDAVQINQAGTGAALLIQAGFLGVGGGIKNGLTTTASNLTLTTAHNTVVFTATATATLPAATGSGQTYRLICRTGTLTIDPNGAETVQGAATLALTAGQSVIITDTASGLWE